MRDSTQRPASANEHGSVQSEAFSLSNGDINNYRNTRYNYDASFHSSFSDAPEVICKELQEAARLTPESRYQLRLHGVLLVAQGIDYSKVGQLLGVSARSVENWMSRFKQEGLEGLREEKRPGRPNRLTEDQLAEVNAALLCTPHRIGLDGDAWDGKTLADWIAIHTGVRLGLRQCQRMIRQRESAMRDSHSRAAEAKQKRHKAQRKDSKP